jgi:hypothetical protein
MRKNLKHHNTIFISSTTDLMEYRQYVWGKLNTLRADTIGMEIFGSRSETPLQTCLEEISKCQVFVCIVGMRYGSIHKDSGKSFVQLEYEEAIRNKLYILIYMVDEEKKHLLAMVEDKGEKADKLTTLKDFLLQEHTCDWFSSPGDLATKVEAALEKLWDEPRNEQDDFEEALRIWRNFCLFHRKDALEKLANTKIARRLYPDSPHKGGEYLARTFSQALNGLTTGSPITGQNTLIHQNDDIVITATQHYYGENEGRPLSLEVIASQLSINPSKTTSFINIGKRRILNSIKGLKEWNPDGVVQCTEALIPEISAAEIFVYDYWDRWPAGELSEAFSRFPEGFKAYTTKGASGVVLVVGCVAFFPINKSAFNKFLQPGKLDLSDWNPWNTIPEHPKEDHKYSELPLIMYINDYFGRHDFSYQARVQLGRELVTELNWWFFESKKCDRICTLITTPDGEQAVRGECSTLSRKADIYRQRYEIERLFFRYVPHRITLETGKEVFRDFYLVSSNPADENVGESMPFS